jgi:tRNA threonylcarbamoyladenosine biosynthesis protein TsaE
MRTSYKVTVGEVSKLARSLSKSLKGGEIFALIGPLGAGKTTFVQHLAKNLKVTSKVSSPTFILRQDYSGKLPKTKKSITLHHLDLYRSKGYKEIENLGLLEFWGRNNTVTAIEWADKIIKYLPKTTTYIYFTS